MKENSIEEEIKIALDKFLDNKDKDSAILIVEKFILGNYILRGGRTNIVKDSLRYILSDYKRVLKENEELKETLKCTQNSWYEDTIKIEEMKKQIDLDNECEIALNSKVMDLEKEIEELKTINQMQKYRIEVIDERELISKDKIKEILGIEEDINNEKLLSLLQTIVDENSRLEDIEDRKIQIEYNNVFNKGVKSVEDKIKAKIEELDEEIKVKKEIARKPMDRVSGRLLTDNIVELEKAKKVLQSLLEKE